MLLKAHELPEIVNGKPIPKPQTDFFKAPAWWLTEPQRVEEFCRSLPGVEVEEIGRTAGGRPIIAAAWGPREILPDRTCNTVGAALGAANPAAYYGKGQRAHQVLMFVGAAHGSEFEGTVAALNYLNIIVTGEDLLHRKQEAMAAEGRNLRFIVIPFINVDGRERTLEHRHSIGVGGEKNENVDYFGLITQGLFKNGDVLHWPQSKLYQPMTEDRFLFFGSYVNDAGVNLVYDCQLGPDMQPENAAMIRYCRREKPDCVILSHSNNGSLVEPAAAFMPAHFQRFSAQIAALVGMRCRRAGLAKHAIAQPRHSIFEPLAFYQSDALYHACGALPLLIEFPYGYGKVPDSHEGLLDIGLNVIDEIAAFGNRYRFRPRDPSK
jgi:hypothetical protein